MEKRRRGVALSNRRAGIQFQNARRADQSLRRRIAMTSAYSYHPQPAIYTTLDQYTYLDRNDVSSLDAGNSKSIRPSAG